MTTRGEYVVEVTSVPGDAFDVVRARIEHLLKLSPEKAEALLARIPGVVTKGLPPERALRVVLRLQAAGLAAVHRRARPGELQSGAADTAPQRATKPAAPAVEPEAPEVAPDAPAVDRAEPVAPAVEPLALDAPAVDLTEPAAEPDAGLPAMDAQPDVPATPRSLSATDVELTHDGLEALEHEREPTGFDQIPSLDATRVDLPGLEFDPDPKLTPMSEAGFGAADVVLPVRSTAERRSPTLIDAGPVSRPIAPSAGGEERGSGRTGRDAGAAARAVLKSATPPPRSRGAPSHSDDADPTMIVPPTAEPPGPRHRTLTDADVRLTPSPDVAYRSTGGGTRRSRGPTPPPDEVLRSSGVDEDGLSASMERRRGRFGRRLSGLVILPVALSWALTATFLYLLLPESAEGPVRSALWMPLAAATAVAALAGALAAALATGRIVDDVSKLRDAAHRLAMGELEAPVRLRRPDELGDIAASLERLRVSLQEALGRLRKR